jgi:hypothetical protein
MTTYTGLLVGCEDAEVDGTWVTNPCRTLEMIKSSSLPPLSETAYCDTYDDPPLCFKTLVFRYYRLAWHEKSNRYQIDLWVPEAWFGRDYDYALADGDAAIRDHVMRWFFKRELNKAREDTGDAG